MSLTATARSAARALLLGRAVDHTSSARANSALILAPHPDDETIGCGGRIALGRATGVPITVVVATDGAASHEKAGTTAEQLRRLRSAELRSATGCLGVDSADVIELSFPDGELSAHIAALATELCAIIEARRPDEVYATSVWEAHPDHQAAGVALRLALANLDPSMVPTHFEYPVWLWGDWPVSRKWGARGLRQWASMYARRMAVTVELTDVCDVKWSAMQAYRSQLGDAVDGVSVGLPDLLLRRARQGPEIYFPVAGAVADSATSY